MDRICEYCGEVVDYEEGTILTGEFICYECADEIPEIYDEPSISFADPGGKSALRAESPENPRNLPCPTCNAPNRLTPADVAQGYQCDACADRDEGGYYDTDNS